jgi:hypothetical protein
MSEKIFHLHLQDSDGRNKKSLECHLKNGSISYCFYTGWTSTGVPLSLSNMMIGYRHGNTLPVENLPGETKKEFTKRVIDMINNDSVENVVKEVNTEVKFA